MEQEEFEARLRESPYLRHSLADLFRSIEKAVTLIILASAQQQDMARLEADLLRLQSEAAAEGADPTRDHILTNMRLCLLKKLD
ncbi:MAG: hypothetical protein IPG33_15645 [Betaproteobacteria bacterium]|jgi:hypothetical protein|nr:hypothetical protein [Betaproteobacteria bacterium]